VDARRRSGCDDKGPAPVFLGWRAQGLGYGQITGWSARKNYLTPGRRSQPTRTHRSSSSRLIYPASISNPVATRGSPPGAAGEPATGDDSRALDADVVAALSHLAKVVDERL
jgi:hypothetical protein